MDDLISRQAAIDAIEAYFGDLPIVVHYDMLQLIKKLPSAHPETCEYWDAESNYCALYRPSAQPEPRWIPVTERLPEKAGEYLVTVKNLVAETKSELIDIALWNDKIEENRGFLKADEVTAWMPLPQPYERSEE